MGRSGFVDNFGFLAFGIACPAEFTTCAVASPCGAMFATIKNDLQMQTVPVFSREQLFQISFRLFDVFPLSQPPALRQSVNMGVDRKSRNPESLGHHDAGRLVPDSREGLQFFKRLWDLRRVFSNQYLRESLDGFGFLRGKSTGSDDFADLFDCLSGHFVGSVRQSEQRGGHLVNAFVGALGAEQHRDQQRVGIRMIKGHRRVWVQLIQPAGNEFGALRFSHVPGLLFNDLGFVFLAAIAKYFGLDDLGVGDVRNGNFLATLRDLVSRKFINHVKSGNDASENRMPFVQA